MGKNHDTILSRENKNHKNAGRIVGERNIASAGHFPAINLVSRWRPRSWGQVANDYGCWSRAIKASRACRSTQLTVRTISRTSFFAVQTRDPPTRTGRTSKRQFWRVECYKDVDDLDFKDRKNDRIALIGVHEAYSKAELLWFSAYPEGFLSEGRHRNKRRFLILLGKIQFFVNRGELNAFR